MLSTRIQHRRGTAEQWTSTNVTLSDGELGFERNTNKFKIGNGSDPWNDLPYFGSGGQTGSITIADLPPGGTITIDKTKGGYGAAAGSWPTSRPTDRADLCIVWTGDTDPGAIAIAGDKWDREA